MAKKTGWTKETSPRKKQLPSNWKRIRQGVLDRDNHQCQWPVNGGICGARATHCDHIERGLDHRTENLRALCMSHHMKRTGKDGGQAARAPRRGTKRPPEQHPGKRRAKDSGDKSAEKTSENELRMK